MVGFGRHFMVNVVLLAIPIGVTLGILFGLDGARSANGQAPLYKPSSTSSSGSGSHTKKITTTTYCEKSYGITPDTKGTEFTLNPNQWGWTASEGGGLCMNVTTFDNGTYPTNSTAPTWSVTWQYPQGPDTQPVHAYPNVLVDKVFPKQVSSLSKLDVEVVWTYAVGNASVTTMDQASLTDDSLNANVAIDMFLDSDEKNAQNSSSAKYEVMVWFADFGSAAQPIGLDRGYVTTTLINGTTFGLYNGTNDYGQYVLTWVATTTVDTFYGDILTLITTLFGLSGSEFPSKSDYLGYLAFGTEAYYSNDFVTFETSHLAIDVE